MHTKWKIFLFSFIFIIAGWLVMPAYAEVTSLQTDKTFYKMGDKITFSGKVAQADYQKDVNLVIYDPNKSFVLITGGFSDANGAFQIVVDPSGTGVQNKFSVKGIYNATAFISNQINGTTVSFIFSSDGSPVIPSPPSSLHATYLSSTEIDLSWSAPTLSGGSSITGYQIQRNDGNGFNVIQSTPTSTYKDTGLVPSKQYSYKVLAINSAGTSNPSNVVNATTLSVPVQANSQSSSVLPTQNNAGTTQANATQSILKQIQQRIENAKKQQELLQSISQQPSLNTTQTPSISVSPPSLNTTQTPSISVPQHNITLSENGNVNNVSKNNSITKIPNPQQTLSNYNNILYPLIALAGVGIVVAVIFSRKNKFANRTNVTQTEEPKQPEKLADSSEDDYALMVLKNRLAKGEISIEEFNALKDALKEP